MKAIFSILLILSCTIACAQKTFYISNSGKDSNSGLTPSLPLRNLHSVQPGNKYLFKSGGIYYLNIRKISNPEPDNKIIISSYGNGSKPIISSYKTIKPLAWKLFKTNIWKVDLRDTNNYSGFVDSRSNSNVGFLKISGKIYGKRSNKIEELSNPYDFFCDSAYLYVMLRVDPLKAPAVRIACNDLIIHLSDNMTISNISLCGTGSHGIRGEDCKNVSLKNLDLSDIGGSFLFNTTRYGNGIELWNSATNCIIEGCRITNVYDAAITMQGKGNNQYFTDVTIRNNTLVKNEQSFEFWINGFKSGFKRCQFINNLCVKAGYGWSHSVRPNKSTGVHILNYSWEVSDSDLVITKNTFKDAASGYIFIFIHNKPLFKSFNNKVYLRRNIPVQAVDKRYPLTSLSQRYKAKGTEQGTIYHAL
jgi:hypothetical protein